MKFGAPVEVFGSDFVRRYARSKSELSNGQQLLGYWQDLLGNLDSTDGTKPNENQVKTEWKTEDVRDLLHTAIRVRQGRVSGVLPEQLMSTFIQIYQKAMTPDDHSRLFQLLCQEFGVQGKLMALYHPSQRTGIDVHIKANLHTLLHYDAGGDVSKAINSWKQAASKCTIHSKAGTPYVSSDCVCSCFAVVAVFKQCSVCIDISIRYITYFAVVPVFVHSECSALRHELSVVPVCVACR